MISMLMTAKVCTRDLPIDLYLVATNGDSGRLCSKHNFQRDTKQKWAANCANQQKPRLLFRNLTRIFHFHALFIVES